MRPKTMKIWSDDVLNPGKYAARLRGSGAAGLSSAIC